MIQQLLIIALAYPLLACGGEDGGRDPRNPRPDAGSDPDAAPLRGCAFDEPACTGETLCLDNDCEAAFNRIYKITVLGANVPTTNQGIEWDLGGGAPDLFAEIYINDELIGVTSAVQDMFSASWNQFATTTVIAGTKLTLAVVDEDIDKHDTAFLCEWNPIEVTTIRNGTLSCTGELGDLSATIEPN